MEYCCNFCKKTFGNKGALGSQISFCNKNPDRRTKRSKPIKSLEQRNERNY